MLGLKLPTDPRWVNLAEKQIGDILTDHAYCEQKAATNCISIIQSYPEYENVVQALIPLVTEEWGHFKMVLDELKKRSLKLGFQRKDEYVNKLYHYARKGSNRNDQLVEKLLFSALIEARSCERFKLLSQEISDDDLKHFYKMLMVSEAGHFKLFLDLAISIQSKEKVMQRWEEFLEFEGSLMKEMALRGDRVH